jgi:hypothetical protein
VRALRRPPQTLAGQIALAFGFAVIITSTSARADTCGKPDLIATFPGENATSVPQNARLSAYYAPNAVYDDEPVVLVRDGTADEVPATFDAAEVALHVMPPEGLESSSNYVIQWPGLHGTGTTSLGTGKDVEFTVSSETDDAAPEFDGLTGLEWDVGRYRDDCADTMVERFQFDLRVGHADDDANSKNLALIVFQTRGPNQSENDAPRPVAVTPYPGEGATVRVERSLSDGGGLVCFAALVRDLVPEHAPSGAEVEVCSNTTLPPFFYGCAMRTSALRSGDSGALAVWPPVMTAIALSLSMRLRHRRPDRRCAGCRAS